MNFFRLGALLALAACMGSTQAQTRVVKTDTQIDGLDPGIKETGRLENIKLGNIF